MTDLAFAGPLDALDAAESQRLFDRTGGLPDEAIEQVDRMAQRVRARGDDALRSYTKQFDDVDLDQLRVPAGALDAAHENASSKFLDAFRTAAEQVRAYHESIAQVHAEPFEKAGVRAREKRVPIPRAGLYVPGGRAAYPSTVLMTAIPAQVAGVDEITLASPPGDEGLPHELVLAAARELGIDHVVALGGAQAVLGLAYGTETIPEHPVVAGPGNVYVQAAKEHVAGRVRIDSPAGPSEVAVLVGPDASPHVAAREMVAQAEHDPRALAVGITVGDPDDLIAALENELADLPRSEIVEQALAGRGALIQTDTAEEGLAVLERLAPEHCVILHEDGPALAEQLESPACIVTGTRARVPMTDYAAGPSHVLPTGGHAIAHGGVTVTTFTKQVHLAQIDDVDPDLAEAAVTLARLEGFEGHARAIEEDDP